MAFVAPGRHALSLLSCAPLLFAACFNPQPLGADDETTSGPPPADGTTTVAPETTLEGMTSLDTMSQDGETTLPPGTTGDETTGDETTQSGTTQSETTSGATTEGESTSSTDTGSSSSEGSSSTGMMCLPGPAEVEFESLGGFVAQGDAWQSFTANTTGDVVEINLYWNLGGTNDEFIINVYEGEGTGGMLLHSEMFPGQGVGMFVGFDVNVLSSPIPIETGMVYTVEGVDTFGWQTANGVIAGSNSSLGMAQHKNIQVWVEPCV